MFTARNDTASPGQTYPTVLSVVFSNLATGRVHPSFQREGKNTKTFHSFAKLHRPARQDIYKHTSIARLFANSLQTPISLPCNQRSECTVQERRDGQRDILSFDDCVDAIREYSALWIGNDWMMWWRVILVFMMLLPLWGMVAAQAL